MSDVVRAVGYVGLLQRLTWNGPSIQVQAYLWGGGGGGGGRDGSGASKNGGNGTGGAFSQINLALNAGDILDVAVGQGGGRGESSRGGAAGGLAGESLVYDLFNSRGVPGSVAVADRRWSPFMNAHAVWASPYVFEYTYSQTIFFPYTGFYTFTYQVDDFVNIYIDDNLSITYAGFRDNPAPSAARYITRGIHTIKWIADNRGGSVSGIALTITASWSGGNGSAAGPTPYSGGGGGGGGATALFKNNELIAIAGGGGGGGGGGNRLGASPNAPGPNGVTLDGVFAGQNGQSKSGDGGGAGGGGGGYAGGQGGSGQAGDVNGLGGSAGRGLGTVISSPNQRTPGGSSSQYYAGGSRGGRGDVGSGPAIAGQSGYAVFVLEIPGIFVRSNAVWVPVQNLYLRQNNSWRLIENSYVRSGGSWRPVRGANPPRFGIVAFNWGRNPRANGPASGGGGGGGKIICTKLYELGLMDKAVYEADQTYGAIVAEKDPALINGYHYWANIVVEWMSGGGIRVVPFISKDTHNKLASKWATAWAKEIATPWAEHMQYKMGGRKEDSKLGRVLMTVGAPLSRLFANKKTAPSTLTALGCVATFTMLYALVKITKLIKK